MKCASVCVLCVCCTCLAGCEEAVYRICAGFFLKDSSTDKRPDTVRFNDAPFTSPRLQHTPQTQAHKKD